MRDVLNAILGVSIGLARVAVAGGLVGIALASMEAGWTGPAAACVLAAVVVWTL